jgi:hypothetical protein
VQSSEPPLSYLQVGPHRVAFESDTFTRADVRVALQQSTIQSVTRLLGPARVIATGDASASLRSICYKLRGSGNMILILESEEMGGGKWITGFSLLRSGGRPEREHGCGRVDFDPAAIVTNSGVRLGLSRKQMSAILGIAGRDSAGVVLYDLLLEKRMKMKDGTTQPYTEGVGYEVRFRNDRVIGFSGSRVDAT